MNKDRWYTTSREASLFTFMTMWGGWGYGNATEEDARKAMHFVWYGKDTWPSHCIWMLP